jgi:hypothetical protein
MAYFELRTEVKSVKSSQEVKLYARDDLPPGKWGLVE